MGAKGLPIRGDVPAAELRRLARREKDRAAAARMQAIAGALEGMTRAEAARLAGMERQALRDAVMRYNAEGLAGLRDRPRSGRRPRLTEAQRAVLRQGGAGRAGRGGHRAERLDLAGAVPGGRRALGRVVSPLTPAPRSTAGLRRTKDSGEARLMGRLIRVELSGCPKRVGRAAIRLASGFPRKRRRITPSGRGRSALSCYEFQPPLSLHSNRVGTLRLRDCQCGSQQVQALRPAFGRVEDAREPQQEVG